MRPARNPSAPHRSVIDIVAPLAPSAQIVVRDVLGLMVQMPDRQDDARASRWVWFPVSGSTVWECG